MASIEMNQASSSGVLVRELDQALPLLVSPRQTGAPLQALHGELIRAAQQHLASVGAVLFRGFRVAGVDGFRGFAEAFGHTLLGYEFGSTPRSRIVSGVYTSTEYPAHQSIPLHNEQSYSRHWPLKLWFYCAQPSETGGETPIADSRRAYQLIPESIRRRFSERGLMYVRNYGNGLDVPWQDVFNTSDHREVEAYCREHAIVCEWKDDGELRTRQVCQAVAQHPVTGDRVWFNQAHLFHVSGLAPDVREALLEVVEPEDLPRNVYYGDGSPLHEPMLDEIRAVLDATRVVFAWQTDDILMLDNMLTAHARSPFTGPRRVVVAMAEGYSEP